MPKGTATSGSDGPRSNNDARGRRASPSSAAPRNRRGSTGSGGTRTPTGGGSRRGSVSPGRRASDGSAPRDKPKERHKTNSDDLRNKVESVVPKTNRVAPESRLLQEGSKALQENTRAEVISDTAQLPRNVSKPSRPADPPPSTEDVDSEPSKEIGKATENAQEEPTCVEFAKCESVSETSEPVVPELSTEPPKSSDASETTRPQESKLDTEVKESQTSTEQEESTLPKEPSKIQRAPESVPSPQTEEHSPTQMESSDTAPDVSPDTEHLQNPNTPEITGGIKIVSDADDTSPLFGEQEGERGIRPLSSTAGKEATNEAAGAEDELTDTSVISPASQTSGIVASSEESPDVAKNAAIPMEAAEKT